MAAHLYWRLYITAFNNANVASFSEIEMRASPGGADQCNGGTASASSYDWVPEGAFDNTADPWTSAWGTPAPAWIRYQFPAAVEVAELALAGAEIASYSPKDFALQWSDDDSGWTTQRTWENTSWTSYEVKVLDASPPLVAFAADLFVSWTVRAPVAADAAALWSLRLAVAQDLGAGWGLRVGGELAAAGTILLAAESLARHDLLFVSGAEIWSVHALNQGIAPDFAAFWPLLPRDPVSADHHGVWPLRMACDLPGLWTLCAPFSGDVTAVWDGSLGFPLLSERLAPWRIDPSAIRVVTRQPSLLHKGRNLPVVSAEIFLAEGSPCWSAWIAVSQAEDFARLAMGEEILVTLYDETFLLRVERREAGRDQAGVSRRFTILAVSPLAWAGFPHAAPLTRSWPQATDALTQVTSLIGPVQWQLPDWTIPAGRLDAVEADPLALARQIAGAVGGVVESLPDGSVLCRLAFPVSIPHWEETAPDHLFTDADIVSLSETLVMTQIVNRLTVSDLDPSPAAGDADLAEKEMDPQDPHAATLRVFPVPWRPVALVHAGGEHVSLTALGTQGEEREELIAFQAGEGRAAQPVAELLAVTWQYRDLGPVSPAEGWGRRLRARDDGWSLARIRYRTRCLVWRARDPRNEEILFLVTEGAP